MTDEDEDEKGAQSMATAKATTGTHTTRAHTEEEAAAAPTPRQRSRRDWTEAEIRGRSLQLAQERNYIATNLVTFVAGTNGFWTFAAPSRTLANTAWTVCYDERKDTLECDCFSGRHGGACSHKGAAQKAVAAIRHSLTPEEMESERRYHKFCADLETRGY